MHILPIADIMKTVFIYSSAGKCKSDEDAEGQPSKKPNVDLELGMAHEDSIVNCKYFNHCSKNL